MLIAEMCCHSASDDEEETIDNIIARKGFRFHNFVVGLCKYNYNNCSQQLQKAQHPAWHADLEAFKKSNITSLSIDCYVEEVIKSNWIGHLLYPHYLNKNTATQ